MQKECAIKVSVNGTSYERLVPARTLLSEFLRDHLGLTGTHVGCEHGVCGSCTVLVDGKSARSCLTLAVQANGTELTTVEGLAKNGELHPVQQAFWDEHAVQCGFCTSGMLLTVYEFLSETKAPQEGAIRSAIAGNICRCTGYQNIVKAVVVADRMWER
jgi:aerobic-type carbon monoxide dehydrogenase small subunit (CoxS/CutS family)